MYAFGSHTASLSVALKVWRTNVSIRLSHQLFECYTTQSVAQTFGLASERTRSAVTPPVPAPHREQALCKLSVWQMNVRVRLSHPSAAQSANCRFGKRTYAFECQIACSSIAQLQSLCKLSVWQDNVRVRMSNR